MKDLKQTINISQAVGDVIVIDDEKTGRSVQIELRGFDKGQAFLCATRSEGIHLRCEKYLPNQKKY